MNELSNTVYTHTITVKEGKEFRTVRVTSEEANNALGAWDKWRGVPVPLPALPNRNPHFIAPTKIEEITPIVPPTPEPKRLPEPEITPEQQKARAKKMRELLGKHKRTLPKQESIAGVKPSSPTEKADFELQKKEVLKKHPWLKKHQT